MRTRTALIYLAVFLVLAGYYYYFEVVRRQDRPRPPGVFQLQGKEITALKLQRADGEQVSAVKNGHWHLEEPIKTRADDAAIKGLLATLRSLAPERQVEGAAGDLEPFGLQNPKMRISFQAGDSWHRLDIGARTPVGDHYYGGSDQSEGIFLLSAGTERSLDKTLFDLRSKDLLTLKSEEVDRLEIGGPDGHLLVVRRDDGNWQAPAAPEMKISSSRVESFLSTLTWLRAQSFVGQEQIPESNFGLDPPRFEITLAAQGRTETLRLGKATESEGIYARSDTLLAVVTVDESLADKIPGSLADLEDRTLFAFDMEEVKVISLELGSKTARIHREDDDWKWVGAEGPEEPETWRVRSLLWKIQELEYEAGPPPERNSPPQQKSLEVALYADEEKALGRLFVGEGVSIEEQPVVLWFAADDQALQPYRVSAEPLKELKQAIDRLFSPEE